MTRVLIVDDDPVQLQSLARIIGIRRSDLGVVTARNGLEAIEVIRSKPIDLVLTDIQMPGMNGFQLLAWILSNQPHVLVFTMTAYPDSESMQQLHDLGNLECFTKPLDIAAVIERLAIALEESVRGHVRNISLAAFLQLIELERKTCTLTVESGGRTGHLYLRDGKLLEARTSDRCGQIAAFEILAWPSPAITITGHCAVTRRNVESSLGFLLMEAMRLKDEDDREPCDGDFDFEERPTSRRPSLSEYPAPLPMDAEAVAVIEVPSGRLRTWAGSFDGLAAVAELVACTYAAEAHAVATLELDDRVEELVLTTPRFCAVARPLVPGGSDLALLVFDPKRANLALERFALTGFLDDLSGWPREPHGV